jgi:Ca2+-binding RTX toxin-like protein
MMRLIRSLFRHETKPAKRHSRQAGTRRVLGMEGLECRQLMTAGFTVSSGGLIAAVPAGPTAGTQVAISVANHDLVINGTNGADAVGVDKQHTPQGDRYRVLQFDPATGAIVKTTFISASLVTGGDVFFNGFKGDDTFRDVSGLRATANGGEGNDTLTGGSSNDTLIGGPGEDALHGGYGNDYLDGGDGVDHIYGEAGNDIIYCGTDYAWNEVFGGDGDDQITGAYGTDYLNGGNGNDTIDGSYGEDYLFGDAGNDTLKAGNDSGYNYLDGGSGNDIIYGSYGGDYMKGGDGDDTLYGNGGDDTMYGENGNDTMYGDAGNDTMYGGSGVDVMHGGDGDDLLNSGNNDDVHDHMYGEAGSDTFQWETLIGDSFAPKTYTAPYQECEDFVYGVDISDPYIEHSIY